MLASGRLLDEQFGDVWVSGEISGVRLASSGHYYFTLKDGDSQIQCACFRMAARYLRFKPEDGVAVIARGRLDVYELAANINCWWSIWSRRATAHCSSRSSS